MRPREHPSSIVASVLRSTIALPRSVAGGELGSMLLQMQCGERSSMLTVDARQTSAFSNPLRIRVLMACAFEGVQPVNVAASDRRALGQAPLPCVLPDRGRTTEGQSNAASSRPSDQILSSCERQLHRSTGKPSVSARRQVVRSATAVVARRAKPKRRALVDLHACAWRKGDRKVAAAGAQRALPGAGAVAHHQSQSSSACFARQRYGRNLRAVCRRRPRTRS